MHFGVEVVRVQEFSGLGFDFCGVGVIVHVAENPKP